MVPCMKPMLVEFAECHASGSDVAYRVRVTGDDPADEARAKRRCCELLSLNLASSLKEKPSSIKDRCNATIMQRYVKEGETLPVKFTRMDA